MRCMDPFVLCQGGREEPGWLFIMLELVHVELGEQVARRGRGAGEEGWSETGRTKGRARDRMKRETGEACATARLPEA